MMISPLERRLLGVVAWLVAGLFAYLSLTSLPPSPPDLAQFYFAGQLVWAGQSADIYNPEVYVPLEQELEAAGKPFSSIHYYNRPAFGALPWALLAQLPYGAVEKLVVGGNLLGILLLMWKLPNWFPHLRPFRPWFLCFPPFIWTVEFGQDTILLTIIAAYAFVLMRRGREAEAGLLLSLCAIKPHLIWLIPFALFFCGKKRTAYWLAAGVSFLAAISFLMVGVEGVLEWRELLGAETTDFAPYAMATLRAIGLQTHLAVAVLLSAAVIVAFVLACQSKNLERALPVAIVGSVILSPHAYIQDASVFAIAAGLSGIPLLLGTALWLPWPMFLVLIDETAFPLAFPFLGLALIAFFTFRRSSIAQGESPGLAATAAD